MRDSVGFDLSWLLKLRRTSQVTPHISSHKTNGHCLSIQNDIEREQYQLKKKHLYQEVKREHLTIGNQLELSNNQFTDNSLTISSSDDNCISSYDADDEIDEDLKYEENNNQEYFFKESDNEDPLFCFCQDNEGTIYSLDRALKIIQERPKLTDRLFSQEDSDDCFHESEYDVIDTEDDLDIKEIVDDETYPKAITPSIKARSHSFSEGNRTEMTTNYLSRSKNKLRTGKVKSLPNIRFPIRNKKLSVKRSITYHGISTLRSETLKEVNEQEELILGDQNANSKIDGIYLSPTIKTHKSESEGANFTSDADYLTTIHKHNDSQPDTNIDTQGEDVAPSKFYDFLRRRKKKRPLTEVALSQLGQEQNGRFRISSVLESQKQHQNGSMKSDEIKMKSKLKQSNGHVLSNNTTNQPGLFDFSGEINGNIEQRRVNKSAKEEQNSLQKKVCVALCHTDLEYSLTYNEDYPEIILSEETMPGRRKSSLVTKPISMTFLLNSYDIITH